MTSPSPVCEPAGLPDVDRYVDLSMERADYLRGGQAYLADLARWLRECSNAGHGSRTHELYSEAHDRLFRATWEYAVHQWTAREGTPPPPAALVAVGGYGNRTLCLRSDVDLLFLMGERGDRTEQFVKSVLLLLIDFKLNLGYLTRSVADCEAKVGTDLESVTSMTGARPVTGSESLFREFRQCIVEAVRGRGRRWFLRSVFEQWKTRRLKYESTVYLLQPNLKEGQGGLRDVDTVRWILFALTGSNDLEQLKTLARFEPESLAELREAISFVLTVRNELHLQSGTSGDLLAFDFMPEIARRLGYRGDELRSAEEFLMADYYRHARVVDRCSSRAVRVLLRNEKSVIDGLADSIGTIRRRRLAPGIMVREEVVYVEDDSRTWFEADHRRILELFHLAARWGYRLSDHTLDTLARLAPSLGVTFRLDTGNQQQFLAILALKSHVARTMADMHECRILGRILPEFDRIQSMVRIDHYHHYTVDEHTLKALEYAERLLNQAPTERSAAGNVARQIRRWDLLNLAILLHDVGKGYGRGHALRGGQIAQRVCERMGMSEADIELVRFLVLSHLKLSHVAQRRDITDPEVARQLAEEIGSLERLRMLYVLTVCDLMAVSPEAWNDWKAQLLAECYLRTAELLGQEAGTRRREEFDRRRLREPILHAMLQELAPDTPTATERRELETELGRFMRDVSDYYLRTMHPQVVARHCLLRREIDENNMLAWQLRNDTQPPGPREVMRAAGAPAGDAHPRYSHLTVIAADVPGLFSFICGALAAKGINIWSAQIFSTRDGYAINQFMVTDLDKRPLSEGLRLDRLRHDLNLVIQGRMSIDDLIARHRTRQPKRARPRAVHPPAVFFDNVSSQRYTILEIRATDRPGLLYRITRALNECHLDIHRSIIATEAYGVVDVFYVTDMEYNKIHTETDQQRIRKALLAAVHEEAD